ncbi:MULTISPECIES: chromosome partitioning protein [unclassified Cryobacterium]|uniref:MinD/ParA family ATP-binding protein n=1 Tax=unclassified Cryobacterium TaxID=2649013 RepID=UPI00106AE49E|nr:MULTISPECIES: chromosome partitioning protein [unclassified Cryobacterium]TFB98808.1 chromosome partitioning protein [Cryobacterium sp. MDB2-A-1]TFC04276.1 chromosome partitioning protein [Cryobacterium sp. MDB2-33-2]TFC14942.1 chromosome partitioning protein [Cryobacterium sp. MDB2-A-2]TFC16448.1 chromosome partitioning protein [Cryobacterium sp. MDB2-10]TFC22852.1 chromosome partitioning protein [Cryobacterium sp. MDB1-18-2]
MKHEVSVPPRIQATIRSNGTGELIIDGVGQQVTAGDEAGVREEIINRVTDAARALGRPVRLTADDEQGQWPLVVHPDGEVEAAGDFIPAAARAEAEAEAEAPAASQGTAAKRAMAHTGDRSAAAFMAEPMEPIGALEELAELAALGDPLDAAAQTSVDKADAESALEREAEAEAEVEAEADAAALAGADGADRADEPASGPDASQAAESLPAGPRRTPAPPPGLFEDIIFEHRALDADDDDEEIAAGPLAALRSTPISASSALLVPSPHPTLVAAEDGPNLADFMSSRPAIVAGPALLGWQGTVRRVTGGLVNPSPGRSELARRAAIAAVQRSLSGPRTIVVLNPKGGAHKTTATLLIAATFGIHRGGYTLAWDNNETMGTLGVRAQGAQHTNTAVDLLRDLEDFAYSTSARVGDLDKYVRNQGDARFDALASDLDPAGAASIDDVAFGKLHAALSRFYRILIIDTGNNMRASNWEAAVETADQLVVVSTIREDTAYGAASLLDGLRLKGHGDKVAQAVTVLASPAKTADRALSARLHDHFSQLTRTVVDVPYDPALVAGGPLNIDALAPRTREAWLYATAAIAEGL